MTNVLDHDSTHESYSTWSLPPRASFGAVPVLVAAEAAVLTNPPLVVIQPIAALFALLGLPALILYRKVRWRVEQNLAGALYAVGLTVLGLIVVGLFINTALPLVGVTRPLDRVPVALTSLVVDLAMLLWRPAIKLGPAGGWSVALRRILKCRFELAPTLAIGSLVLGVIGAVRLNNAAAGAVGHVSLAAHALAVLALLPLLRRAKGRSVRDAWTIFFVATSLLLSTSLRGWFITGHDIQREYIAFLLTNAAGHWEMAPFQSPYNACLSVNILPAMISQTTGLSGVVVFKVIMQLTMALVPVATYAFASRVVSRRQAVVSALVVMAFPTFVNDMPYLVRQEVAFLFFALLVLAATEPQWGVWRRRALIVTFGVGVVLSHYSTTYLLDIALVIATSGWLLIKLWRRRKDRRHRRPLAEPSQPSALLSLTVVVPVVAVGALWSGPVTHTGGHLEETAQQTIDLVLNGGGQPGSSDLAYGIFSGRQASPRERLDLFVEQTLRERASDGSSDRLVRDPEGDLLKPRILEPDDLPLTVVGRAIDRAGLDATRVSTGLRLGSAALLQLLLVAGFVAGIFRSRFGRGIRAELWWFVTGMLGALATVVVLPGLSASYGVLRAFEQSLLVTAPVLAIGAQVLVSRLGRYAGIALVVIWGGMFAVLNGVVPTAVGGYPGQLALANSGLYYDLYYVDQQEVSAATWLQRTSIESPVQSEVISDRVAVTRVQSYLGSSALVNDEFFPTLLRKGTFVFLGAETVRKHQATVFYTGNLISYRYPVSLLNQRLDVVYSSPLARIYR